MTLVPIILRVLVAYLNVLRVVLLDQSSLLLSCMLEDLIVIDWQSVDSAAIADAVDLSCSFRVIIYYVVLHDGGIC